MGPAGPGGLAGPGGGAAAPARGAGGAPAAPAGGRGRRRGARRPPRPSGPAGGPPPGGRSGPASRGRGGPRCPRARRAPCAPPPPPPPPSPVPQARSHCRGVARSLSWVPAGDLHPYRLQGDPDDAPAPLEGVVAEGPRLGRVPGRHRPLLREAPEAPEGVPLLAGAGRGPGRARGGEKAVEAFGVPAQVLGKHGRGAGGLGQAQEGLAGLPLAQTPDDPQGLGGVPGCAAARPGRG